MTRTAYPRSSRRKAPISNRKSDQEECKENNSPLKYLQVKKVTTKIKKSNKENASLTRRATPKMSTSTSSSFYDILSPRKKSSRQAKSATNSKNQVKNECNRNVLSDKTNKQTTTDTVTSPVQQSLRVPLLKTLENKNKILTQLAAVPKYDHENMVIHNVPVYKADVKIPFGVTKDTALDNKEAVYEFEVDENEEPVKKKKRKKRVYTKKNKIGPTALTINNIKYSSTESLVSLPEKTVTQNKKTTKNRKTNLKSFPSITSLTSTEETCSSINSIMSHPPSKCFGNKNTQSKQELSVLVESQSEQIVSPLNSFSNELGMPPLSSTSILATLQGLGVHSTSSHGIATLPTPMRCKASPHLTNVSTITSRTFLSSTPCKRVSQVVHDNSVFDESLDVSHTGKQSSGCAVKSPSIAKNGVANCFGFDELEEIDEPVSPIKKNNNLYSKTVGKTLAGHLTISQKVDISKPSAQEVIEMLKASIPKKKEKKVESKMNDIDKGNIDEPVLPCDDPDDDFVNTSFNKVTYSYCNIDYYK